MNTRQIEYIMEIARQKNMQRASEVLYISQSTLSQTLLKVEKELNCPLFVRSAREMTLTKAGELYIRAGQEMLEIEAAMKQQVQNLSKASSREYRIGISSHEGMEKFLAASGKLQSTWRDIEVHAIESKFKAITEMLQRDELDLGIVTWHTLENLPVNVSILSNEEICLIAPDDWCPDGCDLDSGTVSWSALQHQKLILPSEGSTIRSMVNKSLKKNNIQANIAYEISNIESTKKLVAQHKGVGFLPRNLLKGEIRFKVLSLLPPLQRYLMIVYKKNSTLCDEMAYLVYLLENQNEADA